jgi:alpha-glucosidase
VDGFRFDACNHQFHDAGLRDNPPAAASAIGEVSTVRADNPYAMQRHLYDKSQPENLAFLERLRALLDSYGAVGLGEVGDENAPPVMAQYTERGRRLHLAYSFSLLTTEHSAGHLRRQVQALDDALQRTDGWGCWAVSNHDVPRVSSRWNGNGQADVRRDKLWLALLLSLRGSACIYQGEELGLPEAEVPFERLQDPYGRAFWPEFKGRDGARTPMPWQAEAGNGGFNDGQIEPRLPLYEPHLPLAVDRQSQDPQSMLSFSRELLAWRRRQPLLKSGHLRFLDAPEPFLCLERYDGDEVLQAVFNLSDQRATLRLDKMLVPLAGSPFLGARMDGDLALELPPYGVYMGVPIDAAA